MEKYSIFQRKLIPHNLDSTWVCIIVVFDLLSFAAFRIISVYLFSALFMSLQSCTVLLFRLSTSFSIIPLHFSQSTFFSFQRGICNLLFSFAVDIHIVIQKWSLPCGSSSSQFDLQCLGCKV